MQFKTIYSRRPELLRKEVERAAAKNDMACLAVVRDPSTRSEGRSTFCRSYYFFT